MSIVEGVRINEAEYNLENGKKGKLAVFIYGGDEDPRPILNDCVRKYVDNNKYYEFVDAQQDCPWVRVVMSNICDMKQYSFDDFMVKWNRLKKLKKLKEI